MVETEAQNDEVEWFIGQRGRPTERFTVTIGQEGRIYLGVNLAVLSGFTAGHVQLGYVQRNRILRLRRTKHEKGTAKIYSSGGRGVVLSFLAALAHWGLIPKLPQQYDAEIVDGEIVIKLDKESRHGDTEDTEQKQSERESRKAAALDAAIEAEDDPSQLRNCANCMHNGWGICRREGGKYAHCKVVPTDGCEKHVHQPTGAPSGPEPVPPAPRPGRRATRGTTTRGITTRRTATRGIATRGTATRGTVTRGTATRGTATRGKCKHMICPECKHKLWLTARGIVPHDENGMAYTAGRGDREHPCPGTHLRATKSNAFQRVICPECEHEVWITARGIVPHDENGVAYIAGRGDREHPCPGIHNLRRSQNE